MIANIITLSRLFLLIIAIFFLYANGPVAKFIAFLLTIMVIVMDAIDGVVARAAEKRIAAGAAAGPVNAGFNDLLR